MALIFLHALLLLTKPTITTTKEWSHRMSWLPLHLTCTFATSSVVGREVPQMGVSFMMQGFMTSRSQMESTTLQMQAIPFVMHFLCHSEGFSITSGSVKVVV